MRSLWSSIDGACVSIDGACVVDKSQHVIHKNRGLIHTLFQAFHMQKLSPSHMIGVISEDLNGVKNASGNSMPIICVREGSPPLTVALL
ncbi:hypothetical protein ACS0TY_019806 [Phlomoides rotata]